MGCNNCNDKPNCCHQSRSSGIETSVENCGCCCLIHQRFTLDESFNFTEPTTVTIFQAADYVPACVPGQNTSQIHDTASIGSDIGVQQLQLNTLARVLPFGNVIVRNVSNFSFDVTVVGFQPEDTQIVTVPPRATSAVFAPFLRRVDVTTPTDPIRALFTFDIFFQPTDPIIPGL